MCFGNVITTFYNKMNIDYICIALKCFIQAALLPTKVLNVSASLTQLTQLKITINKESEKQTSS